MGVAEGIQVEVAVGCNDAIVQLGRIADFTVGDRVGVSDGSMLRLVSVGATVRVVDDGCVARLPVGVSEQAAQMSNPLK